MKSIIRGLRETSMKFLLTPTGEQFGNSIKLYWRAVLMCSRNWRSGLLCPSARVVPSWGQHWQNLEICRRPTQMSPYTDSEGTGSSDRLALTKPSAFLPGTRRNLPGTFLPQT